MRSKFKKALAVLASAAMCGSMLLNFPDGTFEINLKANAAEGGVAINEENFPDPTFRTYVDDNFDTTDDDALDAAEIAMVTSIAVYGMGISDLKGVEYFTALTTLDCGFNQLTSLDITNNTALTKLNCSDNQLTSLDVTNNTALTELDCASNQLTSLDVTNNTALEILYCYSNQLTSLDVRKNTALTDLDCHFNQLTSLEVTNTNNTALKVLLCYSNQLTSLDVSKNMALTYLDCESNQLTSLDVTNNTALTDLYCYSNQLTSLDMSKNTALTYLYCNNNQLTSLDVSKNTALTELECTTNQLTSLDVSKNTALTNLVCYSNRLLAVNAATGITSYYNASPMTAFAADSMVLRLADYGIDYTMMSNLTGCELSKGNQYLLLTGTDGTARYVYDVDGDVAEHTLTASITFSASGVAIDETNFPDETFRNYVSENFDKADGEGNKDNFLSAEEISDAKSIRVYNKSITDLKGVEYFTALTYLNCVSNQLTNLDVTNNTALTTLDCFDNQLTSLDVTNNTALTKLGCSDNQLTSLNVTNNTALEVLSCYSNQLTSLDVTNNTALKFLHCHSNQLTSLDVSKNTALTDLDCYSNQLTSLDVSKNTALTTLNCRSNQLTSLDVTNNTALTDLYCYSNTYKINFTGNTFDLSTLPEGFDVKKASEWTNATIEGNTLTVTDPTQRVTYTYDLGNDSTETFTLEIASAELTKDMVQKIEAQTYTGEEITPVTLICGDYTLDEGTDYTIKYADNTNAGTASYTITGAGIFTGELTGEFEIVKATPDYEIPTGLKATYGDILADVELPEGWAWVNNTQSIGTVGTNSFDAVFTPADTANYNTVTELVDITVGKATPKVTPIIPDGEYTEGDALPKIGFESVIDGVIEWITKLVDGLIEGENELEWQFTPDDTDNYEVVTGTEIVEAQATTTTTTTTTAQPTTTSTTTTTTVPTTTSTTTTTTTSTDTTTSTTETTTTTTHIASAEELCEWAVKDYEGKTGVTPANAEIEYTTDDIAVITLTDAEGNVLDVYTIDPTTGTGTESDGGEVNLPQTGYSVVYNYIMLAAAAMVFFGIFAMAKSRKRDEE